MLKKLFITHCVLILLATIFAQEALARAGGGGGGGGGGSSRGGGSSIFYLIALGVSACSSLYYFIRRQKAIHKAGKILRVAYLTDRSWNIELFRSITTQTFHAYQNAWSKKDLHLAQELFHVDYFNESLNTMNTTLLGKINILSDIQIQDINLVAARDQRGTDGDMFVVEVKASMIDYTVRESDGVFLESTCPRLQFETSGAYRKRSLKTPTPFTEYWAFIRVSENWVLYKILQKLPEDIDLHLVSTELVISAVQKHRQAIAKRAG